MRRLLVLASLLIAVPARADDAADAEKLADEGDRLVDAGRIADACPKFEQSLELAPDELDVLQSLASCREDNGQLATAWTKWRDVKARARAAGDTKRAVIATDHITAIEPRLAHLTISLPRGTEAPDGLTVSLDGEPVAIGSLGAAAAIDQGDHRITADATGFAAWSKDLFIENGAFKTVTLDLAVAAGEVPVEPGEPNLQPPPTGPAPEQPSAPSHVRKYVGLGALGVGVVALGVGAWAGFDAKSQRDDARGLGCNDDLSSCPTGAAFDAATSAYARANLSSGLVLGGAAIAVVGTILWLTAPSGVTADVAPDHATVAYRASF